jgi:chromosome segregation ATPase
LSESPGKVAEFFNNIIKLNVIDEILSETESIRRKNNRDIEENKKSREETAKEIAALSWVEVAAKQIEKIEKLNLTIEEKNEKFEKLNLLVDQFHRYEDELAGIPENLSQVAALMDKIENIQENIDCAEDKIDIISELLEKYDEGVEELEEVQKYDLSKVERLMTDALALENKIIKKEQELVKAESILDKYRERASKRAEANTLTGEIKSLMNKLPKTCPTCNQPVNKEMLI